MKKFGKIMLTSAFVLYLFVVGIWMIATPDRDVSDVENRTLAQVPELKLDTILGGSFMKEFEVYFTDQFPFRDTWLKAYIQLQYLLNKTFVYDYFVTDTGWILPKPTYTVPKQEMSDAARQVNQLASFLEEKDIPLYYFAAPNKVTMTQFLIPDYIEKGTYRAETNFFMEQLDDPNLTSVNMVELFFERFRDDELEQMFFKTDHHWNGNGAIEGYRVMKETFAATGLGIDAEVERDNYEKTCVDGKEFVGSYNRQLYMTVDADELTCSYVRDDFANFEVVRNGEKSSVASVLGSTFTSDAETTSYADIFTNDWRELIITNPAKQDSGKKLLIIKDSYANAIAFSIAQDFYQTFVYDPRFNRDRSVTQYIEDGDFDAVTIFYNSNHLTGADYQFD
ncbi:DHHW family protein [Aquibacillus salsiterrae]|uniref:DHHW family protein n=1 Tax=Aquibacillus salsiterrae TaxID=2950439 RepID=A0A9X3WED2_9BACI|nr:DHHW family protein [Aquibacillus salsiterrae]MDC3416655.1 DHHW family protein [Aquibacillus salsiterrae]